MKRRQTGMPALELIEEAVHLLRTSPFYILGAYYAGTVPFILALLYFWVDMSQGAFSQNHAAGSGLMLAVLFIWMKSWQSVFGTLVRARLCDDAPPPWTFRRIVRLVETQTILQTTGLLVLPAAMLVMLPYIWVQAWYQNVTVLGDGEDNDLRKLSARALRQARLWPQQCSTLVWLLSPALVVMAAALFLVVAPVVEATTPGWTSNLLGVYTTLFAFMMVPFSPLGIMIAVNFGFLLENVPQILERIFGIENVMTMGGDLRDSTYYAICCAVVYLALDPVQKTAYAMRCFYGESLQTGEDLKVALRRVVRAADRRFTSLVLILATGATLCVGAAPVAHAADTAVSAEALNKAIDHVLEQREYAWRLDRKTDTDQEKGALTVFMEWIQKKLYAGARKVQTWIDKIVDWIRSWRPEPKEDESTSWSGWRTMPRWTMYGILIVLAIVLGAFVYRAWRVRRFPIAKIEATPVLSVPDIEDESVSADALPEDGWLALARELMEKGEWRLAVRALFLAGLALLARNEMIRVAKHKSNHEYERELARRAHAEPEILNVFSQSVTLFERVWYGTHEAGPDLARQFNDNQNRMRALAEKP